MIVYKETSEEVRTGQKLDPTPTRFTVPSLETIPVSKDRVRGH